MFRTLQGAHNAMREAGNVYIGGGYFSNVYQNEERNSVIKIATYPDGWYHFARYAMDNPDNPHLPNIWALSAIHNDETTGRQFYIAEMERLSETYDLSVLRAAQAYTYRAADAYTTTPDTARTRIQNDDIIDAEIELPKALLQALKGLMLRFGSYIAVDLHRYNVMRRGDDLVITDPLAHIWRSAPALSEVVI